MVSEENGVPTPFSSAQIAGLVIVGAIAVIGTVGGKVLTQWTSVNGSL